VRPAGRTKTKGDDVSAIALFVGYPFTSPQKYHLLRGEEIICLDLIEVHSCRNRLSCLILRIPRHGMNACFHDAVVECRDFLAEEIEDSYGDPIVYRQVE
jgi:hypothetical protein